MAFACCRGQSWPPHGRHRNPRGDIPPIMKITDIVISHHRLPLDPPFCPSWDTRPRAHFDATIVRVETDEGLTGVASGDVMMGFEGHEHLFIGPDPPAIERPYRSEGRREGKE